MNLALADMPVPFRFRPQTPMSDEELMRFCAANEMLHVEREVSGEIRVKPIAGNRISRVSLAVNRAVGEWTERDGRGVAFASGGFTLPDGSMLGAYSAWMLSQRWASLTEQEKQGFGPMCPDFVVEIVGPFDKSSDLQAKMQLWIANGAQLAWLIDPIEQSVTIYRPNQSPEVYDHPTSVHGDGPINGFELAMSRIWE